MRVTTAFNRMLQLPDAWVRDVEIGPKGSIVTASLRRRRTVSSGCGASDLAIKDWRTKGWRHLDSAYGRCVIECTLRRIRCPDCGDCYEAVGWARPGFAYTRDFEDLVAWLAQQMAFTRIVELMQIAWSSISKIADRVAAEPLVSSRPEGVRLIGADEIRFASERRFPPAWPTTAGVRLCGHRGPQCGHPAGLFRLANRRATGID